MGGRPLGSHVTRAEESARHGTDTTPPDPSNVDRVVGLASRVPVAPVAVVCGITIGLFVALGILQRVAFPEWGFANLDSEVSIATRFSAALLWVAAFWWLLVALTAHPRSLAIWGWWAAVAWLAFDEGSAVHERLERSSGIDWQILYAPLIAVAAMALWGVFRRFRSHERVAAMLLTGAGTWAVVLALELIQNWGGSAAPPATYVPTMIVEEALEMIGATALLIAAMLTLQDIARTTSDSGADNGDSSMGG